MSDAAFLNRLESLRGTSVIDFDTEDYDSGDGVHRGASKAAGFQRAIELIIRNTRAIRKLEDRFNRQLCGDQQTLHQLESIMTKTRQTGLKMKQWLDKEERKVAAEEASADEGSTLVQIKRNELRTKTRKFQGAMFEFGHVAEHFKETLRARVMRQARIVNSAMSDRDMQNLLSNRHQGGKQNVFASSIEQNGQLMDTVSDIEVQRDEMLLIQEGLLDLQELFTDMALLVDLQQENLDTIEANVMVAAKNVDKGRVQIEKALVYQQTSRRRKWCIFFLVLLIIAVLLAVFWPQISSIGGGNGASGGNSPTSKSTTATTTT